MRMEVAALRQWPQVHDPVRDGADTVGKIGKTSHALRKNGPLETTEREHGARRSQAFDQRLRKTAHRRLPRKIEESALLERAVGLFDVTGPLKGKLLVWSCALPD